METGTNTVTDAGGALTGAAEDAIAAALPKSWWTVLNDFSMTIPWASFWVRCC